MLYGLFFTSSAITCVRNNRIVVDTIYACQDIRDDMKVGVRSTAILFGTWIRPLLVGCGFIFLIMLAVAGYLNTQGPAYFFLSVGGTGFHLVWQYCTVDLANPRSCWGMSLPSRRILRFAFGLRSPLL